MVYNQTTDESSNLIYSIVDLVMILGRGHLGYTIKKNSIINTTSYWS